MPFGQLARVLNSTRLTLWNLEDLGPCQPGGAGCVHAVRAGAGLWRAYVAEAGPADCDDESAERQGRRRGYGAGPLISRFFLVQIQPELGDWKTGPCAMVWSEVVSYLTEHPNSLYVDRKTNEVERTPDPRGWAQASRLLAPATAWTR